MPREHFIIALRNAEDREQIQTLDLSVDPKNFQSKERAGWCIEVHGMLDIVATAIVEQRHDEARRVLTLWGVEPASVYTYLMGLPVVVRVV